jgi:hypothetical protein
MRTIIAEKRDGHWDAYFRVRPDIRFSDRRPIIAVELLCRAHGLDRNAMACRRASATSTRIELVPGELECPACAGSGLDLGKLEDEDCKKCYGAGRVE